ncbi:vanadium-dependent haloperoxidase [Roseomonas fluvialis]|uniref:Vanadium-dependent haloperoxidase n=2 Tax=Roseomonas fluvialis TaxID=1750527 RepID=A0ABM7Y579_9PROT|nr:vanadium-dependent haloperoxidase [Roseomonas fluvialis]
MTRIEADFQRRALLGGVGLGVAATLATAHPAVVTGAKAQPAANGTTARPIDALVHRRATEIRASCVRATSAIPIAPHPANGDEARYPNAIGSDTRSLPHNERGEVDPAAWRAYVVACQSGESADFEKVPLGGVRRLGNPLGTLAVSFCGLDPTQIAIPAPPTLTSAERAGEAVEAYWHALLRDVPLAEYQDATENRDVLAACGELSRLGDFRGPKAGGRVTPATLFRGTALYFDAADPRGRVATPPGVLDGPMVSQFLLRDVPFGSQWISARIRPATPGSEFLTTYEDWLRAQNGQPPQRGVQFEATPRYIATGRDLAEWVRHLPLFQTTVLLLLTTGAFAPDPRFGGMFPGAQPPTPASNPYRSLRTQNPASSFGPPHIMALLSEGTNNVIRAAYWQKYFVHRTLRPEAYGGLAHHRLVNGVTDYPLPDAFLRSEALDRTRAKQGTHLLSQIYPDGSPNFSAYPGGASSVSSVTATLLKAFFDESRVIENPVQPDPRDPTRLVPYNGPALTLGGELNKLATNYGCARNWGGIHWRSDAAASMVIGEEVAIGMLREIRMTLREPFDGFSFTGFDGRRITV